MITQTCNMVHAASAYIRGHCFKGMKVAMYVGQEGQSHEMQLSRLIVFISVFPAWGKELQRSTGRFDKNPESCHSARWRAHDKNAKQQERTRSGPLETVPPTAIYCKTFTYTSAGPYYPCLYG